MTTKVPYENASSGANARGEILNLLQSAGAKSVGFMDEFDSHSLILAFVYRERNVQLRASGQGWASLYLRRNPWNRRKRCDRRAYEDQALKQGMIAVNSILRDWVKGQLTAAECGILQFDHIFMPWMITDSGQTVAEIVDQRGILSLPAPEDTND